ncbi:helix-turn-helix domain-containing protein [Alkalihalobacillus sp. MEB130]|uniref:helix-turn-helix domain-containing protein n=1 Tax=Alkalihalobacillus sp. MEB130 TaxID=2976704 RepID=UPI0028DEF11B|nr:helix-turn-helix domain-containing protein [Alkalihalobacillus sp. MEB130]MDT8858959.1 helix-turn-helix domain-containing protein [Alkalihalobacillus sp. MEB130]
MLGLSELGQHLKEAREQKQMSLDDLQRMTKIQKRYLIAIEEGRFDALPGIFYARAFVKTYAEAIGLDPEPLFDQYRNELPNPQREAVTLPSRTERSKPAPNPKKRTKKGSFIPALVAVVFIGIIVVGIWIMAQGGGTEDGGAVAPDDSENLEADFSEGVGTVPEEEEEEPEVEEVPEEEQEEEEAEPEPTFTLTFIESSGNTSFFELENGQLSDVRIEITGERSYIDVKNALGNTFFSGQPTDGEVITPEVEAEERVIFNFGASQFVELYINDVQVEFPLDITHQKIDITVLNQEESE